ARIILEGKVLEFTEAKVSNFKSFNDERLASYDELFKVPLEKVTSITTNGGQYASNDISRAMDGDVNTNWHSGKQNTSSHTNEVVITLDELTTIDRIMYTSLVSRGFAQEFEIYGSRTSEGDTFEKISDGSTSITTKDTLQIKFKETEVRRIKFVYKKGYENWALASEFGLYMPDELDQKIDILFVDEKMNEVNPEFGTIEAINNLIAESNGHPFKDEYIEKLNLAKELIEFGQVESGTANVSKFEPFYTDYINEYDDVYRVKNLSISNNGGQYASSAIKYAIDEDANTHWETGKPNSDSFKNEVILTLEEAEVISRLTYKSRSGGKGFAEQFSIYISPVDSGDNFQKVTEGSYTVTNDMLEIQFDATKAKRVKFVFDKAHENWASISDIRLYKEDLVSKKMKTLFTNGLMDTVSNEFNTIEKLAELESDISEHPLAPVYLKDIQVAKDIVNGTLQTVKTVVAEQYGDRNAHANSNLKFGFGNNNQPTGVVARAGETITVYVDAEPGQPLPQLMFSQQEGSFASWGRTVSLHIGKNVITVPAVSQNDGWYRHDVTPGGAVYIVNPYTEEQQSKAPVIRFASGCEQFPMMDKNTDEEEFLQLLKDYKARLDADKAENPNVMDRKMIDVVEIVSDHLVFTGTATGAYEAYINQEFGPMNTVNMYDDHMDMIFEYLGMDGSSIKNDIKYTRENIRLAQPFGYMYAASGHIGVQSDVMVSMLTSVGGWGVDHEMGHKLDIGVRTIGEVTNNMIPQNSSYYYNNPNKRIPFESHVFKNVISTDSNYYYDGGYFENLAVYWQLEMIYPGYWGKLNSQYRENNIVLDSTNSANDKLNQLAKYSSIALELDLSEHFERHGFWVSDETKELLSQYPKPDIKTWYANYDYIEYDGEGFTSNPELNVNVLKENENIKLSFSVNEEFKDDVLGYEIFKDGELIGFTSTNSFVDTESNIGESVNYTVVPYDKKLNIGEEVVVNSLTPSLSVEQESISIKLREEFDPMNLVKALNYNGEDISSNIVINGEVNVNEKGTYPLEYTIEDNGVVVTKTVNVQVVSNYDYLSDTAWTSITTQYGTPRRNSSIKGRVNNEIKTFDKGFGIHANGKITYDLSNVDYDYFEALVGIDMGIESQSNSSVVFKVIADGEVLATTSVIKHADNMVAINVPVKGVQELVIEVSDGGNGNTSDHAVIANPKLTTNNAKPDLTVTDKTYKLGEVVDFNEGISATDIEDGDLTSSIEIVSNTYEAEKVGRFEVTYRVSDSDNNVVEKISYITVYEELTTTKSKYGAFNNLEAYNEEFKIPVASISNNGGNYGSSVIGYAIDNNRNTHWETGNPNSLSFQNEVVFDLGEVNEIDKIAYAARNGGKGFATKFAIYVSTEAEGNDFRLAGTGSYNGSVNDVIEIDITKTEARRVKFKFIEANQNWASIGEMSFYKTDELSDKIKNELFTDDNKNEVSEQYNTLEKLNALREEVSAHPAEELFQDDLNRAEEIIRNKFPSLTVGETEYVKLRSEYDLMSSVNASDQEDGDITNKVVINSNNFTTNKTGDYKVSYTVTDSDGNIATSEKTIVVYSDSEYLSDIDWDSARTDYGQVRKDLASGGAKIKLSVNGEEKVFDKGIGTHANSEIVYNLEGKNYEYFETYVGIDRNIAQQNNSSVIFKVYADDVEVYNSGIMKWADDAKLVRIPLEGVSELKIVADNAGNGNASDHASFGDAKFLILNAAPTLSIPKSVSTKVGYPIELNEEYSASDAEDGDLTNNIEVAGEVNFNKAGKYELTYKVTDSDGNTTTKTRTIAVVDMNDYTYLTEYDWNSTNNSYTAPKKDISISGRTLRLTGENGQEVSYERGIGSHSTSTIIYNLSDKDYAYFTSYIGVDRQMYGTVGSVSFEVWVDGEKKFDSGLMTSRDSQKYVEVDINGAKELKLVVTDGGNGNGSDHATWGDTKLHFANNNGFEINRAELDSLIETINNLNKDIYTGESIDNLQEVLEVVNVELANGYTQEEIDNLFIKLNEAYEKLEKAVDLSEVVNISDEYLKEAIKSELNISSNDITIGDMYNLTELNAMGYGISDLEGLQYAKNLETLNLDYNEINDLSKLKGLEKLFNLQAMYQNIVIGSLYKEDNKITVKYDAVNREGKTVELSDIVVRNNITLEDVSLHIDECVDENGVVSFDTTNFNKAYHTLYLVYEDKENNYLAQVTYMFDNR
uniref:NPCBM/NEW2 domain-containing protein n=1 Tax=Clostridium saudiense TaxID=1414720 RepID=UPI00266F1C80